jgi:hypothetical protein
MFAFFVVDRSGGIPAAERFPFGVQAVFLSWSSGMTTLLPVQKIWALFLNTSKEREFSDFEYLDVENREMKRLPPSGNVFTTEW